MRALCAAFPVDAEPAVCNEKWVSENECEVGGAGYVACRVGCVRLVLKLCMFFAMVMWVTCGLFARVLREF